MTKKGFYRVILTLLLVTSFHSAYAQDQRKMIVHMKNGQNVEYSMENVDFVELITPDKTPSQGGLSVPGTVAQPVDLGLSVLWAEHNLGASEATEAGGRYTWNSSDLTAWADGWRLPTEAEWQELYDKCHWSWEVMDGIGGRLIEGKGQRSIFLPATGVTIDDKTFVSGALGVYWTADKADVNSSTSAIGSYFDSANIYRIEYPVTNKFTVRLVKDK